MGPSRPWSEVRQAFDQLAGLPAQERADYLERLAARDAELAEEVRSLLAADQAEGGPLDRHVLEAFGAERPDVGSGGSDEAVDSTERGGADDGEDLRTGQRIGPYRVGARVGRGGMGDVYLAEREKDDFEQRVALKMIRRGMDSVDVTRRFHEERRILAGLEHSGIARLLDGGVTADGQAWFSMELVEGTPITTYCRERSLDVRQRLKVFVEACAAVQHAHQRLVVHRDLKPSNVLVTVEGEVKLLDFGIAKALDPAGESRARALTHGFVRPLTPRYASPEQLRGETVTVAADVYALGVVLYELLAGAHPHADEATPLDLERAVLSTTPEAPSRVASAPLDERARSGASSALDADLDNICLMALRKEPERRYPSVQALREDIERFLDGRPVSATPDSRAYRVRKFVARHRAGVVGTAAAVVLLTTVTAAFTTRLAMERDRARLEAANAAEVIDFLEGLFEVADPYIGTDREATARQILDDGAARIETELEAQPDVQARMHNVVGNVYRGLGLDTQARTHLEEALAIGERVHGRESLEVARTLSDLGISYFIAGDSLAVGDSLLHEALAIRLELLGPQHVEVARVRGRLAAAANDIGEYAEAETLARQALDVLRAALGPEHEDIATGLSTLSLALSRQGRDREAEPLAREALAMRQSVLDPGHPTVANSMSNLALLLERLGEYGEAESLLRERVRMDRERLGPGHPATLAGLNNLAYMLWRTGRYGEAEQAFRDVVDAARSDSLGVESPNWPQLAIFLNNLAVAVIRRGDTDGAIALLREALATNRSVLGDGHPRVAADLSNLGRALLRAGRLDEAEQANREALAMRLERFDDAHPAVSESRTGLADVLVERGMLAEADTLLVAAVSAMRATEGRTANLAAAIEQLAEVRFDTDQPVQGEELLREVIAMRREVLGEDHPELADSLRRLGGHLSEQARHDEAEIALLEALSIAEGRLDVDDPVARPIYEELATLYDRLERPAEAERYRAMLSDVGG